MLRRESQKLARRKNMIEAARQEFLARGYSSANMDAIADAADVGVATVYNYFETKEGVVAALIRSDFSELLEAVDQMAGKLPSDPIAATKAILAAFGKFDSYISHQLMREFLSQAKTKGPVRDAFDWCHSKEVAQLVQVLEVYRTRGQIAASLDLEIAASIIVDLHDRYIDRMTITGQSTDQRSAFDRSLKTLFEGWLAA